MSVGALVAHRTRHDDALRRLRDGGVCVCVVGNVTTFGVHPIEIKGEQRVKYGGIHRQRDIFTVQRVFWCTPR